VLGATALTVGYLMLEERLRLLEHGIKTDGVVVGIDIGARGLRSVEAQFTDAGGRSIVGRDLHRTQWYAANDPGDAVELYYDPSYRGRSPPDILVDRGAWIWSNPAFLILGGIALIAFSLFVARQPRADGER